MSKKQPIADPFENANMDVVGLKTKLGPRGTIGKEFVSKETIQLRAENSKLTAELETAKATIAKMEAQIDELDTRQTTSDFDELSTLHDQVKILKAEIAELKESKEMLERKASSLEEDNRGLLDEKRGLLEQLQTSPTSIDGIDIESLISASSQDIESWIDSIDFTTTDKITLNNVPIEFKLDFQLCSGRIGALARQRVNQYDLQVAAVLIHHRLVDFLLENSPEIFTSVSGRSAYEYGGLIRKRLLTELEIALRVLKEIHRKS